MGRILFFLAISMLSCNAFAAQAIHSNTAERHTTAHTPTLPTPQAVDLLFGDFTADDKILLTLNNNRSSDTLVSFTVYDADGNTHVLANQLLPSRVSRLIDLQRVLQDSGLLHTPLGYLHITYDGILMEVGAQLTLYKRATGNFGVDSPRTLVADYASSTRAATGWVPQDSTFDVSLTNVSDAPLNVMASCESLPPVLTLRPHSTVHHRTLPFALGHALSCEAKALGNTLAALRIVGRVSTSDYDAPVRFYDPMSSTQTSLTATGVRAKAITYATVLNRSPKPTLVSPSLKIIGSDNASSMQLPQLILAPFEARRLALRPYLSPDTALGDVFLSFTLSTEAAPGSLIGALTQIAPDSLIEDIPFRTSNPPRFDRGAYPIRWTGDYTNSVFITNTSDQPRSFRASIAADNLVYTFSNSTLKPGDSAIFDLNALKYQQTPDITGKVIPLGSTFGKFHWAELSDGKQMGLLGRASISSVDNKRRSSFSCGEVCDDTTERFAFVSPLWDELNVGDYVDANIYEFYSGSNYPSGYSPWDFYDFLNIDGAYVPNYGDGPIAELLHGPASNQATLHALSNGNSYVIWENYFIHQVYAPGASECDTVVDDDGAVYDDIHIGGACPTSITLNSVRQQDLTLRPDLGTGIGISVQLTVSGSTGNYDGSHITESLTTVFNDCPDSGNQCQANPPTGFTVGVDYYDFDDTYHPGQPNVLFDNHTATANNSYLPHNGVASCTIKCNQNYYCNGIQINTLPFQVQLNLQAGQINGGPVTNVSGSDHQ